MQNTVHKKLDQPLCWYSCLSPALQYLCPGCALVLFWHVRARNKPQECCPDKCTQEFFSALACDYGQHPLHNRVFLSGTQCSGRLWQSLPTRCLHVAPYLWQIFLDAAVLMLCNPRHHCTPPCNLSSWPNEHWETCLPLNPNNKSCFQIQGHILNYF